MKIFWLFVSILLFFSLSAFAEDIDEAKQFAQEHAQEIAVNGGRVYSEWDVETQLRVGTANYEESAQNIQSEYETLYPEIVLTAINSNENDIEKTVTFSYGQSITDTESWYVNGIYYQANDLDFYRLNLSATLGRILYSEKYKYLTVTPFLGCGLRYINFQRSDFNILNVITVRQVVTERYYLPHIDFGLRFNNELTDKISISGLACFGYIFYNKSDNSALGSMEGGGGYSIDGNLSIKYALNDSWNIICGGFLELQDLKGNQKGGVIWPDNDLNIFGGNIGAQYLF